MVRQAAILVVMAGAIACCTGEGSPGRIQLGTATNHPPEATPSLTLTVNAVDASPTLVTGLGSFAFPSEINPSDRYMFYLHGKIIEDQGIPAISPDFGEYRYEEILEVLRSHGFVVISEQRSRNADGVDHARRVSDQIDTLLASGVPAGSITVVGASKGAAIAILVSSLVADPAVNYVLLGACNPPTIEELERENVSLSGNVLAIHDFADNYAGSCEDLFARSEGKGLSHHSELVLEVGTGHGVLYGPLPEWVDPTVEWAREAW
jgi:hypothetical protein